MRKLCCMVNPAHWTTGIFPGGEALCRDCYIKWLDGKVDCEDHYKNDWIPLVMDHKGVHNSVASVI